MFIWNKIYISQSLSFNGLDFILYKVVKGKKEWHGDYAVGKKIII